MNENIIEDHSDEEQELKIKKENKSFIFVNYIKEFKDILYIISIIICFFFQEIILYLLIPSTSIFLLSNILLIGKDPKPK